MKHLSPEFWSKRYQEQQTGWDLGRISPPLKEYIDQLTDKTKKILIPGCGRGYEGLYLLQKGFKNVFFLDFSQEAINEIKKTNPLIPDNQFICIDYFKLKGRYDLILEQTMFCAIDPTLRAEYVRQTSDLLNENGKAVGLLFNRDFEGGPPYGGNKNDYNRLFTEHFNILKMEECYNSVPPRSSHEVFFIAENKVNQTIAIL